MQRAQWILAVMAFAVVLGGCSNGDGEPSSAIPPLPKLTEYKLPKTSVIVPDAAWKSMAVVDDRVILFREGVSPSTSGSPVYDTIFEVVRSDDAGAHWKTITAQKQDDHFTRLHFVSEERGWMLRATHYPIPVQWSRLFETIDGGKTWKEWDKNQWATGSSSLSALRFDRDGTPAYWMGWETPQWYLTGKQWNGQQWVSVLFPKAISTTSPSPAKLYGHDGAPEVIIAETEQFERSYTTSDGVVWEIFLEKTSMPQGGSDTVLRYGRTKEQLPIALGLVGMAVPGNTYILYKDLHAALAGVTSVSGAFIYEGRIWLATKEGEIFYSPDSGTAWELLTTFPKPQSGDVSILFGGDSRRLYLFEATGEKLIRHGF